jgi:peptide/nickel transport system permease protein
LPNGTAPIIVQASLSVCSAIITEASLSFLGVGVLPPMPS